uniref:SnoaL-like domain-containing protein n=1 Tax=Panagrolaimus sp. PS1159 TaxID=55785 RepID=A0AC35G0C6_9BILA
MFFGNNDEERKTCELTPKFTEVSKEKYEYKDYWPEWYNHDIISPNVVDQKLDDLAKEFAERKKLQFMWFEGGHVVYYDEDLQFDYKTAKEELMKGYESHNFGGTVVCGDGSEISKTKARVELMDHNLPFIGKNDFSLVKYRFYDVCYDGQLIEVNAYVDGVGQFTL